MKKVVTICASVNFYREVLEFRDELLKQKFEVLIPLGAEEMEKSGDFDVDNNKSWFNKTEDYRKKTNYMRRHFDKIEKSDVLLVVNNEKHGVKNYIGGNVLMEMALAFHQKKPIYLLNEIPDESPFLEEIIGLEPIVLKGDLTKIPSAL